MPSARTERPARADLTGAMGQGDFRAGRSGVRVIAAGPRPRPTWIHLPEPHQGVAADYPLILALAYWNPTRTWTNYCAHVERAMPHPGQRGAPASASRRIACRGVACSPYGGDT